MDQFYAATWSLFTLRLTVRVISDAAGLRAKRTIYLPFGETMDYNVDPAVAAETKGFIGERYDADAGLQYLNARYYDPELARFIQPDWFEVTKAGVGTNRYAYSANDPVNASDPGGNWFGLDDAIASGLGAASGALIQGGIDIWNGVLSSWKDYAAAAVSGAVTTETSLYAGPFAGGAAGGAAYSLTRNGLDGNLPSASELTISTGAGAVLGKVGEKIIGPMLKSAGKQFSTSREMAHYFPPNNGFIGATTKTNLIPGQIIDRFGGNDVSRFFSPSGTPAAMRSLPPDAVSQPLRSFEVLKPIAAESGRVAPAFNQLGLGTQFRSSKPLGDLLDQGFLREILN